VPSSGGAGIIGMTERARLAVSQLDHGLRKLGVLPTRGIAPQTIMSRPIRVAIVDDDALMRAGLVMMLDGVDDISIVGEAADGDQVTRLVDAHSPQ
jgi:hypothetical protein